MEDFEFIGLECPYCTFGIDFLVSLKGTVQGCPNCGESVVVPRSNEDPARKLILSLQTEHLKIRRLVPDDEDAWMTYTKATDEAAVSDWLRQQMKLRLHSPDQVMLAIEKPPVFIGHFTLQFTDASNLQAGFEMFLAEGFADDGLVSEACYGLFVLCFRAMNLHRLTIHVDGADHQTQQRLTSVGMRQEGVFRKDRNVDGEWRDTSIHAILREDYVERVQSTPQEDPLS